MNKFLDNAGMSYFWNKIKAYVDKKWGELFTSVSNGKRQVASAITDKGVDTAEDATFEQMADNIRKIEADKLQDGVRTINVIAKPLDGGTVEGGGYASDGFTCNIKAKTNLGYNFGGWEENGEIIYGFTDYSFLVERDVDISALFVPRGELAYHGIADDLSLVGYGLAAAKAGDYALLCGGYGRELGFNKLRDTSDAYDSKLTRTTPTSLSVARYFLAASSIGSYALFGGGTTNNDVSNVVDAYDEKLTRTTLTALNTARSNLAATAIGDYCLFAGGQKGGSLYNTVDVYDTELVHTNVLYLSKAGPNLSACSIDGYALFGGGYDRYNVVDAYDTKLTRTNPTGLSSGRHYLVATHVGVYGLFGGGGVNSKPSNVVDAYNDELSRTTPVPLSVARMNLAATSLGEYAIFAGGDGPTSTIDTNTVDAYDIELTRKTPSTLSASRSYLASVSIGDYALFAGGIHSEEGQRLPVATVDVYTV